MVPERRIGEAYVSGEFAKVGHARSLTWLRTRFAAEVVEAGLAHLDAAAVRLSVPRRLTQRMSRAIYECSHESVRQYSGIAYLSRFGDEIPNWAVFEPNEIDVRDAWPTDSEDPDFIAAMEVLGLRLEEE